MANQNSINNESFPLSTRELSIDPARFSGSASDTEIKLNINTANEWILGIDATDSSFKISQGGALGTNDSFIIDADGITTVPNQTAFIATINQELLATGSGTAHTVGSITALTEVLDRGGDFSVGNGAGTGASFTAPVSGNYELTFTISMDFMVTVGATEWIAQIVTSNATYKTISLPTYNRTANFFGAGNDICFSSSVLADMDASDTATFVVTASGAAMDLDTVEFGNVSGFLMA